MAELFHQLKIMQIIFNKDLMLSYNLIIIYISLVAEITITFNLCVLTLLLIPLQQILLYILVVVNNKCILSLKVIMENSSLDLKLLGMMQVAYMHNSKKYLEWQEHFKEEFLYFHYLGSSMIVKILLLLKEDIRLCF